MEEHLNQTPQTLMLEDRKCLRLTGVTDVDSFDDGTVVADTVRGALHISGSDLHISTLSTETGELLVEGTINALVYYETQQKSGGGLFSRMFR